MFFLLFPSCVFACVCAGGGGALVLLCSISVVSSFVIVSLGKIELVVYITCLLVSVQSRKF